MAVLLASPVRIRAGFPVRVQTRGGNIILRGRKIKGGGVTLNSGNPMGEGGGFYLNANSGDLAMGNLNIDIITAL
jgi:hypothetical protein